MLLTGALFFITACNTTKFVPDGKYLLRSNSVKLETDKKRNEKGELKDQLESLYAQPTNTYYVNTFPLKLWVYNYRNRISRSDTLPPVKSKIEERPVMLDTSLVDKTKINMTFHLNNSGYFHPIVTDSIIINGKKAKVNYHVNTGKRFLIGKNEYEIASEWVRGVVLEQDKNSLFKKGTYYSNTLAGEERTRISELIRNRGFYHFSAENIRFELDTMADVSGDRVSDNLAGSVIDLLLRSTRTSESLNIKTIIKDNKDGTAFKISRIGNVIVYTNAEDSTSLGRFYRMANDSIIKDEIQIFYDGKEYINKDLLARKISIKPNKDYSTNDYDRTLRQLSNLGVFQYVRVRYSERTDKEGNPLLNVIILLSPSKKYDFGTNVEVSGGDIYVIGTAANVTVTNKNVLKGANQLSVTGSYGIELSTRRNANERNELYLFSQNFGLNFGFTMPKFLLPVSQSRFSPNAFPRTILNVGTNSIYRSKYFLLQSINSNITYQWNETAHKKWSIKPAFVNVLNLSRISDTFQSRMDQIPAIRNAYQQTFIEGEGGEFLFDKITASGRNHHYVRLGIEEAGLLMSAVDALIPIEKYAQYVRLDFDMKEYLLRPLSTFAFRFYGGIGMPYGNSVTMPYLKQYFVGGAYSIRGWRPRILGPGSYYDPNITDDNANLFIDQAGDIKLEVNAEYRFTLMRLFSNSISLNGAVFADAGNIWLAKKDVTLPNAEFNINRLYQDIAMSTGAGLRVDFGGFLVIRLDYAFPVKKPYVTENYGWVIDKVSLGSREWRKDNLNFNIAVGYPF